MGVNKRALLLINLGTPDEPTFLSVYRYLTEFLNDPRVIDLPFIFRFILVNLLIIPFRCKKSTEAYLKIWTARGSPLLAESEKLQQALAAELGDDYHVCLAMRYGKPTINAALRQLRDYSEVTVLPLFPQYAAASTGSAIESFLQKISKQWNMPSLKIYRDFYDDPGFIDALTVIAQQATSQQTVDHFIFSYHGLPERHVKKSACQASCDHLAACPLINEKNNYCYRAQCYATSKLLAAQLNLLPDQVSVAFQSRLGRTPWIKPYTDQLLPELRAKGVQRIAVACPSFAVDCLETLEEINIRARQQWFDLGGSDFVFIPCVNDHPLWVRALAKRIQLNDTH